jgi:hypothetical protein
MNLLEFLGMLIVLIAVGAGFYYLGTYIGVIR